MYIEGVPYSPQASPFEDLVSSCSGSSVPVSSCGASPTRHVPPDPLGATPISSHDDPAAAAAVIEARPRRPQTPLKPLESYMMAEPSPIVRMAPALVPKPVREFEGHADDVLDLAWSRGDMLLSASVDGQVTPLDE